MKFLFIVVAIISGLIGIILFVHSRFKGNRKESVIGIVALVLALSSGLAPLAIKDKTVATAPEVAQMDADEGLKQQLAEQKQREILQQLAQPNPADYKAAVKALVDAGDYAKAIELVNPDGAPEEAAAKHIFLADLYIASNRFGEAEEHFKKAVEIFPSAKNIFYTAGFYDELNRFEEATEYYGRSLGMDLSPADKAVALHNLGSIYVQFHDHAAAEKLYAEALEIKRRLAAVEPQAYIPDIARTLNNLGYLNSDKGEYDTAEQYYNEALEIYRKLANEAPDTYQSVLAGTLHNIGVLYRARQDNETAAKYHREALELHRDLAAKEPKTYKPALAASLNNLGAAYRNMKEYDKAAECHTEALGIRRELAATNPQAYNPDLAMSLYNLGNLYAYKPEPDYGKSEECWNESLEIYRKLAKAQPQAWNPYLAQTLVSMSIFYLQDYPNKKLSTRLAKEAVEILEGCNDTAMVRELLEKAKRVAAK